MSGPSTRSHRSSVRGLETTLAELAELLKANKSVVMITGAGLSAASGIPTFRGGSDSVWSVTAAAQGRRSVFRRDPLRWYNEFFLRHFPMSFVRKKPNAGHEAIAALAREYPELRVITQNIDGLHRDTVNAWPDLTRLIEAHGRLGLFKCIAEGDKGNGSSSGKGNGSNGSDSVNGEDKRKEPKDGGEGAQDEQDEYKDEDDEDDEDEEYCTYSFDKAIEPEQFPESIRVNLDDDARAASARGLGRALTEIPRCPGCGEAASPMSLLFDEDYDSHSFYNFEKAEDWFKEADAMVFIGTSFAVTLTSLAIREAKRRGIPVFDFNVNVCLKASPALDAKTVLGRAEATLPALAEAAGVTIATASVDDCPTVPPTLDHTTRSGSGSSSGSMGASGSISGISPSRTDPVAEPPAAEEGPSNMSTSTGAFSLERRTRDGSSEGSSNGGDSSSGSSSSRSSRNRDEAIMHDGDQDCPEAKRAKCAGRHAEDIGGEADAAAGGPVAPQQVSSPAEAGCAPGKISWGGGAAYMLEPALEIPLRKDQVRVDVDEAYSRKPHPDPEVEASIETLWQEQLVKNPLLFNGSKFRLAGYSTEGDYAAATAATTSSSPPRSEANNSAQDQWGRCRETPTLPPSRCRSRTSPPTRKLRLRLGLTDYRTFRGTNWSPLAARLAADSARDHPWLEGAYLSQKLGVTAVVQTKDGFLLSLCRSSGVAEGKGMMDAPGGHPEPENLGLTVEVLRDLSGKTASSRRKLGQQAVDELFNSAVQEVVDETNVPRSALGEPLLSGFVRQGNSFGAPSAAFIITCSLDRAEVSVLYTRGAKEAFESTHIRTIPMCEVLEEGGSAWFTKRGLRATPSFQGALELWRDYRLARKGQT